MTEQAQDSDVVAEVGDWVRANWDPTMTLGEWWGLLGRSGWGYPHFPTDWFGKGLPGRFAGVVSIAVRDAGAVPAPMGFGPNMAAPTLLDHGTDEQKARHLPGIVTGADAYCQLFSEPNAGSDLAGLQCRAVRDGDTWIVNGQKVWTSGAQTANKAMLVARTNVDVPKHAGISYFFVDLDQPGVEIRPIREITGREFFNEVFLTDVRVPDADLIGGEGNGWAVANTTLAYERAGGSAGAAVSNASPGPVAGDLDRPAGSFAGAREAARTMPTAATAARLAELARTVGRLGDAAVRRDLVRLRTLELANSMSGTRARALSDVGRSLPGYPNMAKMAGNNLIRHARHVAFTILREDATLYGYEPEDAARAEALSGIAGLNDIVEGALFASAPPIYGGSDQIQRNIVGERVLGLPREPAEDRHVPFKDLRKN